MAKVKRGGKQTNQKAGCLLKNQAFSWVKPYIPLRKEHRQEVFHNTAHESYSLEIPKGVRGEKKKKKAENEKHLWEDTQSKKLQEPNEPSLPLSGVVQLQTQKTLPKWVADADTKSTLTKEQQMTIRKTLHTRLTQLEEKNNDSKGITCVFDVGGW